MRRKRIEPIEGKQPDLASLPPGCSFAPRCKQVMTECREGEIDFFETGSAYEAHEVRCLLYKGKID
jgi:oligopeptide/dipeptide ABC transporter ATP-binding protein